MKKTLQCLFMTLIVVVIANPGYSQKKVEIAKQFFLNQKSNFKLTSEDILNMEVMSLSYSKKSDLTHVYFQQYHNGIPIHNAILNAHINKDDVVVAHGNRFVEHNKPAQKSGNNIISPEVAIGAVVQDRNIELPNIPDVTDGLFPVLPLTQISKGNDPIVFDKGEIADKNIIAKLVYQPTPKNELRLAWEVFFCEIDQPNWWLVRVDAETGEVLDYSNQMLACDFGYGSNTGCEDPTHFHNHSNSGSALSRDVKTNSTNNSFLAGDTYRVYPEPIESPNHAAILPPADGRTLVMDPADPTASPFGWHDTDGTAGAEFTITRGNNVHAFIESSGFSPDGGPGLNFDFPLDLTQQPNTYQSAAVTNLFYWINYMHDFAYNYGFDEANGNFQENNYGNGGVGGDYVLGRAQYPGFNNAFFGTPPDGSNPEMLMLLWNTTNPNRDGDLDNGIIAHEFGHGISNRLTGGPATTSCLNNIEQMGEGWSDFFTLMTTIQPGDVGTDGRGIGTYALGQSTNGGGIRPTHYSTDMGINPATYGDIGGLPVPHGVGYVWATMLWDMNWALIDVHGNTDGFDKCVNLVMEGMKIQPCNPGFVDGRDAILAADVVLYGGENQCLIWEVFARRGLGFSASQGSSNSTTDGVEAFDTPTSCFVDATPLNMSICIGSDAVFTIEVGDGFSNTVNLSAVGEPAGTTVAFAPMSLPSNGGTSTLTISNTGGAAQGTYTVTVTADDGLMNKSVDIELIVYDQIPVSPVLVSPGNMATGITLFPNLNWQVDPNVASYLVEIATDAGFSNIVASAGNVAGNSWTSNTQLNSLTTYYWRVQPDNTCGTGPYSSVWSFETGDIACQNFASTDVPVSIGTVNPNTVTSSLLVSECGSIVDVNVTGLDISHTAIVDLDIYLTSPSGTIVQLMSRPCGNFDDILINFDDQAPNGNIPCPATNNGSYQPFEALAAFIGEDLVGNWTLTVADRDINDGGSINGWSLDICYTPSGETPVVCYRDEDNDTYGDPNVINAFCNACAAGWVQDNTDCNDDPANGGADINPSQAEVCFDAVDNDCDGMVDEDCCPAGSIIYVNESATGANDGTSWDNALTDFQHAIVAGKICGNVTEIWVAEGTYLPSRDQQGNSGAGRNVVFYFDYDIEIYGGFPNTGNPDMADRDPLSHTTILSGDIGTPGNSSDNAFTILYTRNISPAFILDGFQLSDGNASNNGNFPNPNARGGAMFNDGYQGGNSSPTVRNCMFINNSSNRFGGAVYNNGSDGGTSSPAFTNCGFFSNSSPSGGAFYNNGNSNGTCNPTYTNCSFAGNIAEIASALILDGQIGTCEPVITNCSFGNNTTNDSGSGVIDSRNGIQTIYNSIFWANNNNQIIGGTSNVTNSIIQGGFAGVGVFDIDPLFVDAANNDLRLQDCSPAIDAGDDSAPGLVGINEDLDDNNRFVDASGLLNLVDMGAYEFQGSVPVGATVCYIDQDGDSFGGAGIISCVACGTGYTTVDGDCDDTDSDTYPGAAENESATDCMKDADNDGYGDSNAPAGVVAGTDCDDTDSDTYPGAAENESATDCMKDADNDGYGDDNPPVGVIAGTDCDDNNDIIYPGAILSPVNVMGYQICQGDNVPAGEGLKANAPLPSTGIFSSSPNAAIPDNPAPGVDVSINVPASFSITGMTIELQISHTYVGDLKATLTAPDGLTVIQLFNRPGTPPGTFGCGGNNIDVIFDDFAVLTANDFENTCGNLPAIAGTFQPIDLLSTFNGLDAQGDWTLTVSDHAGGDVGTVDYLALNIEGIETITWWDAPVGGNQVGTGTVFDPTSIPVANGGVDPNVAGLYPYFADFTYSATCVTYERVQADFQVGLITSVMPENESCAGFGDGSITVNAVNPFGGQIGYSIDNGANFQFNNVFEDLTPGTYNVLVQIFGGPKLCTSTASAEILAGSAPTVWYKDADGDGYSDGNTLTSCTMPDGYIANPAVGTDCNDNNADIHPGASELCDGLDNDCDGNVPANEADNDGDGYRICNGDCDDSNANIHPGATEICNGIDDNCDGNIDEGVGSGLTYTGNVTFSSQSQLDDWLACYSIIDGNLTISGYNINNLGPLMNIVEVTGTVNIYYNGSLFTLDGLDNLATVGGSFSMFYNFSLNNCCAIDDLLTNGGITGAISIFFNAYGSHCNSAAEIMTACPLSPLVSNPGGNNSITADALVVKNLKVYPNPASNTVSLLFNRSATTGTVKVVDLLGRIVFVQALEEGVERIDINLNDHHFENGIYMVTFQENGELVTKQLVVQQ